MASFDPEYSDHTIRCSDGNVYTSKRYLQFCGVEPVERIDVPRDKVRSVLCAAGFEFNIRRDMRVTEDALRLAHRIGARRFIESVAKFAIPNRKLSASLWLDLGFTNIANYAEVDDFRDVPAELFVRVPETAPDLWRFVLKYPTPEPLLRRILERGLRAEDVGHFLAALHVASMRKRKKRELCVAALAVLSTPSK